MTARPPPGLERFTVPPRHFADHLRALRDAGRVGLTVSQFAACLRNGSVLPELPVVVTFDDGYADFLDAAERLEIAGLPATLYMTTGQIGAARMLTQRQLQSLGGSPVEVPRCTPRRSACTRQSDAGPSLVRCASPEVVVRRWRPVRSGPTSSVPPRRRPGCGAERART